MGNTLGGIQGLAAADADDGGAAVILGNVGQPVDQLLAALAAKAIIVPTWQFYWLSGIFMYFHLLYKDNFKIFEKTLLLEGVFFPHTFVMSLPAHNSLRKCSSFLQQLCQLLRPLPFVRIYAHFIFCLQKRPHHSAW